MLGVVDVLVSLVAKTIIDGDKEKDKKLVGIFATGRSWVYSRSLSKSSPDVWR